MATSESRPFTAATSKLAYAQAFAGPNARRRGATHVTRLRLARSVAGLRRWRKA